MKNYFQNLFVILNELNNAEKVLDKFKNADFENDFDRSLHEEYFDKCDKYEELLHKFHYNSPKTFMIYDFYCNIIDIMLDIWYFPLSVYEFIRDFKHDIRFK